MGFPELYLAIEGYTEANRSETEKPVTKDEVRNMMELYPD